MEAQKQML